MCLLIPNSLQKSSNLMLQYSNPLFICRHFPFLVIWFSTSNFHSLNFENASSLVLQNRSIHFLNNRRWRLWFFFLGRDVNFSNRPRADRFMAHTRRVWTAYEMSTFMRVSRADLCRSGSKLVHRVRHAGQAGDPSLMFNIFCSRLFLRFEKKKI